MLILCGIFFVSCSVRHKIVCGLLSPLLHGLYVCLLHMIISCAQMTELIKLPLGVLIHVNPRNHVLDGVSGTMKSIVSFGCTVDRKGSPLLLPSALLPTHWHYI